MSLEVTLQDTSTSNVAVIDLLGYTAPYNNISSMYQYGNYFSRIL